MDTSKQRIILVGFGFMGEMHAQAYASISQAEIVAIVDAAPDVATQKANRLKIDVPIFASLSEALDHMPSEIVDVCLPTDQHVGAVVEALESGKHVFCEKPLALSMEQAACIGESLEKAKTFFQVGHCIRFWPEYQAFAQFVREGTAGRLLSMTLQRRSARPSYSVGNWLNEASRSLGAAVDLHIHDTDFIVDLLGTPPAVFSRATKDATGYSHIFTDYLYPDIIVHAEGGWNYPSQWGFQMAFQAIFEKASVEYDSGRSPTMTVTREGEPPGPLPFVEAGGGNASGTTGNVSSLGGYVNELIYFVEAVAQGRAPEIATLTQATESLRVVLQEVHSASTGQIVSLKE